MKVLQVNSVCGFGSTGRIATDIADLLLARGDDCKIVYGRGDAPEKYRGIAEKISSPFDNKVHGVLTRLFDLHGFGSKNATRDLIKKIRGYGPDLVHLHNLHGYYLNIEILFRYLKKAGIPVVWTLHDCWTMTGHCSHFSAVGCNRYQTECHNCPQLKEYPATLFGGNVKNNYKRKKKAFTGVKDLTIITPSQWLCDVVKTSFLKEYPVLPIYNGVDLSIFYPRESDFKKKHGLEDKIMLLGAASTWTERKGLYDFVSLSKRLDPKYKLVLTGLSDEQIRTLPDGIVKLGRTETMEELAEIYSAADIFINASVEETMGLTTAEALACGTPVITYNKTAVPEVPDKTCGIVVEPGVENLLSALEKVDFSAEDCVRRGQFFEKTKQFEKYLAVYDQIVKKDK